MPSVVLLRGLAHPYLAPLACPLQLNGGTFVTLTLQGNTLNVSSSPLAAGGGAGFTTDLTALIVEGTVLSNSSFTGVETLSMVGINATNASAVTVATQVRGPGCAWVVSSVPACLLNRCGAMAWSWMACPVQAVRCTLRLPSLFMLSLLTLCRAAPPP